MSISSPAQGRRASRPLLGVLLILAAATCFGSMDSTTRYLGRFVPVLLILWSRYTFQALVMLVWLTRSKTAGFRTAHPRFQIVRGVLLLMTSGAGFYGVQLLPVAEFTALSMITPVLVTLLAAWLLSERVSRLRWVLVAGGFAGVLIVIRPGSGLFGWAAALPLGGACTYAAFQVLTSKLAAHESPFTTHFYTGAVGSLVLTPMLFISAIGADSTLLHTAPQHLALLLVVGLLGTVGHLLLVIALGTGPASSLMPFMYFQIAVATAVGWLIFRNLPDGWAWVGMAVITVCGAASAWLNVRDATPKRPVSVVQADSIAD